MDKVAIQDFQKLDIRIGTIVKAEVPGWSHWVMKLTVDIGQLDEQGDPSTRSASSGRQSNTIVVFAGIMKFYKPEEVEGRQVPFVVNMEPKKIGPEGDYSEGMMMAADHILDPEKPEEGKPVLFSLDKKVANGTRVR